MKHSIFQRLTSLSYLQGLLRKIERRLILRKRTEVLHAPISSISSIAVANSFLSKRKIATHHLLAFSCPRSFGGLNIRVMLWAGAHSLDRSFESESPRIVSMITEAGRAFVRLPKKPILSCLLAYPPVCLSVNQKCPGRSQPQTSRGLAGLKLILVLPGRVTRAVPLWAKRQAPKQNI